MRWRVATALVMAVALALPTLAYAVAFGPVEPMAPQWIGDESFGGAPQIVVDGAGRAHHVNLVNELRDPEEGDQDVQAAVYERCGSPVAWERMAVLGDLDVDARSTGLAVAPGGAAIAIWVDGDLDIFATDTIRSSFKPAGGTWGVPQVVVEAENVGAVDVAMADNGDATVLWQRSAPSPEVLRSAFRPAAGGTWSEPVTITPTGGYGDNELAVAPDGTAMVVQQTSKTALQAFVRPPGQPWPATGEAVSTFTEHLNTQIRDVEAVFTPAGVAVVAYYEHNDYTPLRAVRAKQRASGWSGAHTLQEYGSTGGFGFQTMSLARHPQGAVLAWTQDESVAFGSNQAAVARYTSGGGWEAEKVYDPPSGGFGLTTVAADTAGNIVFAVERGTSEQIFVEAAQVPDLVTPWPSLSAISPTTPTDIDRREPFAAGGGRLVLAWEVHDGTGSNRSEAIASGGAAPSCSAAEPPPPSDQDGDGVPDNADACPSVAAATSNGCPALTGGGGAGTGGGGGGGSAAPPAGGGSPSLLDVGFQPGWRNARTYTVVTRLRVLRIPAGATVTVACRGRRKACPFKTRTLRYAVATARADLARRFKRRRLPARTVITVKVTAPQAIGRQVTYTVRGRRKAPSSKRGCVDFAGTAVAC